MKAGNETAFVKQLLQFLNLIPGVMAWRQNQGAVVGEYKGKRRFTRFAGVDGISDIIGVAGGRFIAVEAKMLGRKPTPAQEEFLARVRAAGGLGLVCYSLDDLQAGLREAGVMA